MTLDLPALDRPTKAISGSIASGAAFSSLNDATDVLNCADSNRVMNGGSGRAGSEGRSVEYAPVRGRIGSSASGESEAASWTHRRRPCRHEQIVRGRARSDYNKQQGFS